MSESNFDAFISYRRREGADLAKFIRSSLQSQGHKVFMDTNDMPSGPFPTSLSRTIEVTPNFIVVLTQKCFDSYRSDTDWFIKEIGQAIRTKRNILPIKTTGFEYPSHIGYGSAELKDIVGKIKLYHAVEYFHSYADEAIKGIVRRMIIPEKSLLSSSDMVYEKLIGRWTLSIQEPYKISVLLTLNRNGTLTLKFPELPRSTRFVYNILMGEELGGHWKVSGQKLHWEYTETPDAWIGKLGSALLKVVSGLFPRAGDATITQLSDRKMTLKRGNKVQEFERMT